MNLRNGQPKSKDGIDLYSAKDFEGMHAAGRVAADILDEIVTSVFPGQNTGILDSIIEQLIEDKNVDSATIGYRGYKHASCISVNHVVCHGIPSEKILKEGDIVNVDVTALKNGWHGDTSRTFKVGNVSVKAEKLIKATYESMMEAIEIVKDGIHLGDIGSTIQTYVEKEGFSVVQDFCGHGIGETFHKEPNVLHYGEKGSGEKIKTGMISTIEPMINQGTKHCKTLKDGWTVETKDGRNSAQWEHTIAVTKNGAEILTKRNEEF